ncbi:unnamed protein product [Urochloa humidicola]
MRKQGAPAGAPISNSNARGRRLRSPQTAGGSSRRARASAHLPISNSNARGRRLAASAGGSRAHQPARQGGQSPELIKN